MSLLSRAKSFLSGTTASGIPRSWPIDWFQQGYTPQVSTTSSVSEAAISAYAQTIAQLPIIHYKINKDGSRTKLTNSRVAKVLRRPNDFQSRSDFMLNLVHGILGQGNGYFVGDGQSGGRDSENMYLMDPRATRGMVIDGDIFYAAGGHFDELTPIDPSVLIPSRFVGHVRLHTPFDPLLGVSPLRAAAASMAAHGAIVNHQAAFFSNMARPSGVLSTELTLKREQVEMLRQAWEDHSKGLNAGQVPILTSGLKWQPLMMTSQDAELVNAWKMTVAEIARVFRIPPMLIGDLEFSTYNNAEQLIGVWLSTGLGFLIDHIELCFDKFFDLPADEKIECDADVLLRTDAVQRVEALKEAVTGGIYSPNEARAKFHLKPVKGGDMPRVQMQMVPLDWKDPKNEPAPAPTAAAAAPAPEPATSQRELVPSITKTYDTMEEFAREALQ